MNSILLTFLAHSTARSVTATFKQFSVHLPLAPTALADSGADGPGNVVRNIPLLVLYAVPTQATVCMTQLAPPRWYPGAETCLRRLTVRSLWQGPAPIQVDAAQLRRRAKLVGEGFQPIRSEIENAKRRNITYLLRQLREGVVVQAQVRELRELANAGRKRRDTTAEQVPESQTRC